MASKHNADLSSAAMLAALLLCALGAPVEYEPTDSPAGDFSGEEQEVTPDLLSASPVWDLIIGVTAHHQKEFEDEFQQEVKYRFLNHYKLSSLPADCPSANFSKEACLQRLAEGLHTYMVLFKHVEKEYPSSSILLHARYHSGALIGLIKEKMRNPGQVTVPTSRQEQQLLQDMDNPSTFHRKMTAHNILRQLHNFLRNGKVAIRKREMPKQKRRKDDGIIPPIHPSYQMT
ncbi:interleukin-6 [Paralichthys olivaceus]|uniref:Interleukin-6 n=1 Tax=Paralichthys olivaceus TaxID=8255 RepID=IL6_PAROL|nr:PREDICTED: interleukin-6 [Paralichthys olivaceus]A0S0B0.1 RecName: Full=Interleukin-6; Short=IL-6; Flags: Precursor [Paralichthys olivaceus]ABB90401.1 interleukin 6 [Paralichthys olivaceus]ABJ53333.1 interleukin-6 [Paralichthys olivaceus]